MLLNLGIFDFEHTYIGLHENFVSYYTNAICLALELDPYRVNIAAFYHDHGKYLWPRELLTKKELSEKDWAIIKRHPATAADVIFRTMPDKRNEFIRGDPSVADLILMHHEKPDGSGYYRIKDLPVESVVLSVADIFEACMSDRIYRKGMKEEDALMCALTPFKDYLDRKGFSSKKLEEILRRSAMRFKIERVD